MVAKAYSGAVVSGSPQKNRRKQKVGASTRFNRTEKGSGSRPLPRFEIRPLTVDEGCGYLVEFPDYPGCMADGKTAEEAISEGSDALASYLRTLEELGRPVPASGQVYGGQWRQRVPKSLHAALARRAEREGVSLNMLVTTLLAEGLGRRSGA
jgi:antitoxin HicB